MREVLARGAPRLHGVADLATCCSEYREYERSVTTLVDAFVKPRVAAYAARSRRSRPARPAPFYIMKSQRRGDLGTRGRRAADHDDPLAARRRARSAPRLVAGQAGFARVLTLDGGRHVDRRGGGRATGAPSLTTEGRSAASPVKVPMIDIVTVGTGGGSIAWVVAGRGR